MADAVRNFRLFIAVELPGEVLRQLNEIQHRLQRDPALARLRWVRPEGVHLTLKFLGETPAARQMEIEAAIARAVVGIPPFELSLGRLGTFGSRPAPRVLWIDVIGDTGSLQRLQGQVEREVSPLGFPTERRAFSPHLTLARVPPERAREAATALASAVEATEVPEARISVRDVGLIRSELRPSGAVYTRLSSASLS